MISHPPLRTGLCALMLLMGSTAMAAAQVTPVSAATIPDPATLDHHRNLHRGRGQPAA